MSSIQNYHIHLYYRLEQLEQARMIGLEAVNRFGVQMGRLHEKPVGPHPLPSCQLMVTAEQFSSVIAWLMLNRAGLTVFVHANTGDDLADHTEHALWMGTIEPLALDIFR